MFIHLTFLFYMKKIVLASILKPISDTRMYEKLGNSLAKTPNTEIHIIGQQIKNTPSNNSTFFHPIFSFQRLGIERFLAPFKVFKEIKKIRPDLFIMGTHELLWIGILYKLFYSCKLIYNVEENYCKNIWYTNAFPSFLRPFLVIYIFCKEWFTSLFINHFWLAEKSYAIELKFATWKNQFNIIENKYQGPIIQKSQTNEFKHFLYTGTISENYGIFDCIELIEKLRKHDHDIELKIIGYCANNETLIKLKKSIKDKPYIQLIGGDYLVNHSNILKEIQKADCGILSYQKNKSTDTCIPTKLYEYFANNLVILCTENSIWEKLINDYQAGFCMDFNDIDPSIFLKKLQTTDFYSSHVDNKILWKNEEERLLKTIQYIL